MVLVKLGGSVVTTKKSGIPRIRTAAVRAIAQDVGQLMRRHASMRIVLLHGAGSFGHPLAYRYGLVGGAPTKARMVGAAKTVAAMRVLGNEIAAIFWHEGVPVVPVQSSASFPFHARTSLTSYITAGAVPLLNGDVMIRNKKTYILSADEQVAALARLLQPTSIILLTDVDGIYASFPQKRGDRPFKFVSYTTVRAMFSHRKITPHSTDVTGGMAGKLRALRGLSNVRIVVANGNAKQSLSRALTGKIGTVIRM